ncbi:MAG TPA: peptidylprolyl isomerase [Gemmataceae bacterium]|nr:peptidylprolyl isomerase [Gemmataceae bacterium]
MRAQSGLVRGLASLAVLAVLVNGARTQLLRPATKPAAVVDGMPISMAEVENVLKQAGPTATPLTEMQRKQLQMEAVGMLIDDLLMEQFLKRSAPAIPATEVDKKVTELAASLKQQGKSLADFCKDSGQTEAQLRIHVLNMLRWSAYVKDHLTEADIKRYFDESRDFFDRVAVRASHIVLRVAPGASPGEREQARTRLQALRQEIVSGKVDFAEAAKKYSQCTSAPNGGDIGYFPRKLAVEEAFARAAFGLKVGEVSDVVETDYGLHLIKVTDRKPGQPADYSKIKDEVRELCTEELRLDVLARQRKAAQIEINLP